MYRDKLSRALLDRFDLVVTVPRPRARDDERERSGSVHDERGHGDGGPAIARQRGRPAENRWIGQAARGDHRERVTATERRSQSANREAAYGRMAEKLEKLQRPRKPRKATKPTAGSKRERVERKRKQSERKRGRGKCRAGDAE